MYPPPHIETVFCILYFFFRANIIMSLCSRWGAGRTDTLCFAQKRSQNRFKCLRRMFVPPRQKHALYGALNE